MSGLPSSYTNEITTLNREILKAKPHDILQFCANHFHRRLESQRTEFLLSKGGGGMSDQGGFASSNPFGNGVSGFGGQKGMQSLAEEEDENEVGSPTDANFKSKDEGSFGGFGGGAATGGGLFSGPFGANHDENSSLPSSTPTNYAVGRRVSVSAESMNPNADSDNWKPPHHAKTADQLARLKTAVSNNFLFSHLDDDQFKTVLGALVEKPVPAKDIKVISQGDDGDYFYVVEKGSFDIYIHSSGSIQSGPDGMGNKVASIGPGGSFGELALMYNAPRAATVISTEPKSTLWQLDRMTFRRILMDSAFQRRRMYEAFLEEVPLLANLKPYERSKIADALDTVKFPANTKIINEGDAGDAFYILETGEADAFKSGVEAPVKHYTRGEFFGELALLDDKPRAASVISKTDVKVAKLGRDGFQRLLGPVEGIMRKEKYDDNVDPLS